MHNISLSDLLYVVHCSWSSDALVVVLWLSVITDYMCLPHVSMCPLKIIASCVPLLKIFEPSLPHPCPPALPASLILSSSARIT